MRLRRCRRLPLASASANNPSAASRSGSASVPEVVEILCLAPAASVDSCMGRTLGLMRGCTGVCGGGAARSTCLFFVPVEAGVCGAGGGAGDELCETSGDGTVAVDVDVTDAPGAGSGVRADGFAAGEGFEGYGSGLGAAAAREGTATTVTRVASRAPPQKSHDGVRSTLPPAGPHHRLRGRRCPTLLAVTSIPPARCFCSANATRLLRTRQCRPPAGDRRPRGAALG
jgi:hypothetical protein